MEYLHLGLNNILGSFNKTGGGNHLLGLETLDFQNVLFFDGINYSFSSAWFSRLEGLSKLELSVVNKSQRSWIVFLFRHFFHKLNTDFKVGEDKRAVLGHLGDGLYLNNGFCNDSEVTFMTHDGLGEIGTS